MAVVHVDADALREPFATRVRERDLGPDARGQLAIATTSWLAEEAPEALFGPVARVEIGARLRDVLVDHAKQHGFTS